MNLTEAWRARLNAPFLHLGTIEEKLKEVGDPEERREIRQWLLDLEARARQIARTIEHTPHQGEK